MEDYLRHLIDPQAIKLRESTCSSLANALAATGAVLWAFGLAEQPRAGRLPQRFKWAARRLVER
jgi:hypothetical protein